MHCCLFMVLGSVYIFLRRKMEEKAPWVSHSEEEKENEDRWQREAAFVVSHTLLSTHLAEGGARGAHIQSDVCCITQLV